MHQHIHMCKQIDSHASSDQYKFELEKGDNQWWG